MPDKELDLRWLLSDDDFEEFTNTDEWEDGVLMLFWENGIISADSARQHLSICRFERDPYLDCPLCGEEAEHYKLNNGQWKCIICGKKFSLTSRTYIDNSKLEYFYWWRFAWLVSELRITNTCVIADDLKVSQKTAWLMLETLRTARKQTSDHKFKTGSEVLIFNSWYDVLRTLLTLDKSNININNLSKQTIDIGIKILNEEKQANQVEIDRIDKDIDEIKRLSSPSKETLPLPDKQISQEIVGIEVIEEIPLDDEKLMIERYNKRYPLRFPKKEPEIHRDL